LTDGSIIPFNIDFSKSTKLKTIHIDLKSSLKDVTEQVREDVTIKTGDLPMLEILYCSVCVLVDFNPCGSPNLRNLLLEYSSIPQPNNCFSNLHHLEAFIVKNT
jgi:hypothetical protein